MEKVERNGLVAVVYSPTYGAGWHSWHGIDELLFDPGLVEMVESNTDGDKIEAYCREKYKRSKWCYMSCDGLEIAWLPKDSEFFIQEYDGSESIVMRDDPNSPQWKKA